MKITGAYCYNCDKKIEISELGIDTYYKNASIRLSEQEEIGDALYCKECDSSDDLIILVEKNY